jgi:hypothetical protein
LSFGSEITIIFLFTGSPDRVSTLSGPRHQARYPAGYPKRPPGGGGQPSRFPVAFRPPAFASRSSHTRRGVGPSSRSAYRPEGRTQTGLPRSARTSNDRTGCPLYPGDDGAIPTVTNPRSASAASQRPAPNPAPTTHQRGLNLRGISKSSRNSPARSSPHPRLPDGTGAASAFPRASNPANAAHVRVGTGHRHGPEATLTTSAAPPILRTHSLRATSRRTLLVEPKPLGELGHGPVGLTGEVGHVVASVSDNRGTSRTQPSERCRS